MAARPWKRIEPTTVTKVGWRTIVTKTFLHPDGKTYTFDTVMPEGQEFAAVIALTPDNKVVIARQFRTGPEKMMDELPAGFVDPGETPPEAVERELLEEAGYSSDKFEYLGYASKDAFMNGRWHAFIARDCQKVSEDIGRAEEDIEVRLISIDQLIANAKNDAMTDPTAVLMAYDKLMEIKNGN